MYWKTTKWKEKKEWFKIFLKMNISFKNNGTEKIKGY